MKKKINSLILSFLLLPLVSCGQERKRSEDSSKELTSEETSTSVEGVLSLLKKIKETKSYQIEYTVNNSTQKDILTPNYLYYSSQKAGLVKLENVDKSVYKDDKILYNFEVSNKNEVEVLHPALDSYGIPYFNPYQLDYFQLLNEEGYEISSSDFSPFDDTSLYSTNSSLTYIIAATLSRKSEFKADTYAGVEFSIKGQNLDVSLLLKGNDGNLSSDTSTKGTISCIGKAKDDLLETYFAPNYSLGEALSKDAASLLLSSSLHSEARFSTYSNSSTTLSYVVNVDYVEDKMRAKAESSGTSKEAIYSRGEKGNTVKKYLNGQNKVAETPYSSSPFDEYIKKSKDVFKTETFRKINENTYRYFGLNANDLLYPYCQIDLSSYTFSTVDLTLNKAGKVEEITGMTYPISSSSDSSSTYVEIISIGSFKEADPIPEIVPLKPIEGIEKELQTAFETFKNTSTNFKVHLSDDLLGVSPYNAYTDYYFTKDVILRDKKYSETASNTNPDDHEYNGYYNTKDGLASFYINKTKDSITPTSNPDKKDSILAHWLDKTFSLSSDIFEKDSADKTGKTYKIREGVDDISNELSFLEKNEKNQLNPTTFKMKLDSQGRIQEITYTYVSLATRNATLTFTYGKDISIPSYVKEKLESVKTWKRISSWQEENPELYEQLVDLFGESFAKILPYSFNEDTASNWVFVREAKSIKIYNTYNTEYYFPSYQKLLLENGFTKAQENVYENSTYNVRISFGNNTNEGFIVNKIK